LVVAARSVSACVKPASTSSTSSIWLEMPISTPATLVSVPATTRRPASATLRRLLRKYSGCSLVIVPNTS
jgi:hypothetical protein